MAPSNVHIFRVAISKHHLTVLIIATKDVEFAIVTKRESVLLSSRRQCAIEEKIGADPRGELGASAKRKKLNGDADCVPRQRCPRHFLEKS